MKIYGIKTCDTCRKAVKALPNAEFVDVRTDGLPDDIRDSAMGLFGDALLNTRSTTWRGLSEQERLSDPVTLLAAYPTLMKRPLIEDGGRLTLGWAKDVQASFGL